MKVRMAFSKKDFVVTLVSVLFVMMNTGAINSTGRRRAKEMVCLSNLRKWGTMFEMFTNENNGYFNTGYMGGGVGGGRGLWMNALRPYYKNNLALLLCPEATRTSIFPSMFTAWRWDELDGSFQSNVGSYGINDWTNKTGGIGGIEQYWKNVRGVKGKNNIPVLLDSTWYSALPTDTDSPPEYEGAIDSWIRSDEIKRFCINRHNAGTNGLFMDWSVRKVGLKELWTLKWHRSYDTEYYWTRAGGVRPDNWPHWMRNFKEY